MPSHTSPDIQWKLLSVSLDPAEGKSSISWKGCCGFGEKSTYCPRFETLGSKQPPPPQTSALCCMLVCLLAWWMNTFQKEQLLWGSKQTPVWGEKERFWEHPPLWHLRSMSRNLHFTGMFPWKMTKKISKYQQWHSQRRSVCASHWFGNEKQRHMVTQLAAFANKCRWHIASSGKENLMKAAFLAWCCSFY